MSSLIELKEVIYDSNARGIYCKLPYPNHSEGCPNTLICIHKHPNFLNLPKLKWFAVIEEFDLKTHAQKMKQKHPTWSDRQCRNLLYWQNGVRSRLIDKITHYKDIGDIILTLPEACGVHVFGTMAKAGVIIQRNPDIVRKVMFIGKHSDYPSSVLTQLIKVENSPVPNKSAINGDKTQ